MTREESTKTHLGFRRLDGDVAILSAFTGPGTLEVWWTTASRLREVFPFFSLFNIVFFEMLRRRLHPEIRIRSSPLYPRSSGASSADVERAESFVWRIS